MAQCYDGQGRTASAWGTFKEAQYAASSSNQKEREAIAKSHADKLKPKLAYLRLQVAGSDLDGVEITRSIQGTNNPTAIRPAMWSKAMPVDPGTHLISVSAAGKASWSKAVVVPAEPGTVTVDIPELLAESAKPAGSAAAAAPASGPEPDEPGSGQRIAGWVTAGAGVVGVAVGAVFLLKASSKQDESDVFCRGDVCQTGSPGLGLYEEAQSAQTIGFIAGGLGVAAIAGGVYLLTTAPSSEQVATGQPPLTAQVAVHPTGISLQGTW